MKHLLGWLLGALLLGGCGRVVEDVPTPARAEPAGAPHDVEETRGCGPRALDCEGGACVGGACMPVTLLSDVDPGRIVQDEAHVYVADTLEPVIHRIAKQDGTIQTLRAPEVATGLAVIGADLFFTAGFALNSMPKTGGALSVHTQFPTRMGALAVMGPSIYALDSQAFGQIRSFDRASAQVHDVAFTLSARAIATDGRRAYWAEAMGRVVAEGSTPPAALAANGSATNLADMVVDGTAIYFTDAVGNGRLARVPTSGGPVETVAKLDYPAGIAAWDDALYVTIWGADSKSGSIVRIEKISGSLTTIATDLARPTYLVADERRLFFVDLDRRSILKLVR